METKKREALAKAALFCTSILWGCSFFIVKNTVDVFPPNLLLAIRFTIGCLLLCLIFRKRLKRLDKRSLLAGVAIGAVLFFAYMVQTIGIQYTTPGKNAFLTAIYCVIVPFLFWAMSKKRPDAYNIAAAFICLLGIGLVSLTDELSIGGGDALSLLGGLLFALQIAMVARFAQDKDPVLLTIIQFATAAILSWTFSLTTETFSISWITADALWGILFLSVVSTALCLSLQNVGQKYTSASTAAIILSLEAVFGVLFSMLFYGERLTWRLVLGFALIFAAVLTSVTKLSFLRRKKLPPAV